MWSRRQQTISTVADRLFQDGDRGGQLQNGLLQSSYSTLAGLECILLKTRQGLEIYHTIFQKTDVFRTTVNTVVCRFPLLPEDDIVLFNGVLNHIRRRQDLLSVLLGIGLNTMDLCHMGSPFYLSIIHL